MGACDTKAAEGASAKHKPIVVIAGLVLSIALGGLALAGWNAFGILRVPTALQVEGYAGHLGEWELTATLTKSTSPSGGDLSGLLRMKHVGFCTKDGPEEKTGTIQVRLSRLFSNAEVKLLIDDAACSHSGDLSGSSIGTMSCPGRKSIPLTLWMK